MYKKKSLKFTYEVFSRDTRHAEALKARESSRFKRLSMIRSLNDSSVDEKTMETIKTNESNVKKKQPLSRLEMLYKWRQEKQLKRQLEIKGKKKPFYVGGSSNTVSDNKNFPNLKSSFISQTNTNFNTSKSIKSKPNLPNLKSSFIPQTNTNFSAPKSIKSKLVTPSVTFQPSRIPNSKQTSSIAKTVNNKAPFVKTPDSTNISKSRVIKSINQTSSVAKTVNKKAPYVNTPDSTNISKSRVKSINQTSSVAKIVNKKAPYVNTPDSTNISKSRVIKSINQPGSIAKAVSNIRKPPFVSIPSSIKVYKPGSQKIPYSKENVTSKKGYCFKKAIANSSCPQAQDETSNKTSTQVGLKIPDKKIKKDVEVKSTKQELLSELNLDNIPEVPFNSDISIIKSTSFAPPNFSFQPPKGLNNFLFDEEEEEDDPYEALEQVKLKYMSRTSTPTKATEEKSPKNSEVPICNDNPVTDIKVLIEKSSNISNSNDLCVSELMTLESIKVKSILNKDTDKIISQQTSDIAIEIENKDMFSHQTSEVIASDISVKNDNKEADKTEYQQICEINSSVVVKTGGNEKEEADETVNKQHCVLTVADESKIDNKNIDHEPLVKELSCDSYKNENTKEISVIINEKVVNCENRLNGFNNDDDEEDSLLDAIDLSKIQLMKLEDEESDEDDILVQEIPKYTERKSEGTVPKRVSILKNMSVLKSIAEISEADECNSSKDNQDLKNTPRHSKRISKLLHFDMLLNDSEMKTNIGSPHLALTPRRSSRLKTTVAKNGCDNDNSISLFSKDKKSTPKVTLRRSMRLIELNTPEKGGKEKTNSNLAADFEKLNVQDSENIDPSIFLIDFDSPDMASQVKTKKVSLLYTPERRKSVRKSVRGDLIAFSPA